LYLIGSIGDVETSTAVNTWSFGIGVDNQQVGNTWTQNDDIVSLSMSSDLNIFDKRVGDKPSRIIQVALMVFVISCALIAIQAPQKPVTAAATASSGTFVVGTAAGRVLSYSSSGEASYVGGDAHATVVCSLAASTNGKVFSAGLDDRVREIDGSSFT
jgi:hypothetical protein